MTNLSQEFRLMTSGAFTAAHIKLLPHVEQLTGKKVVTLTTSIGTGDLSIPARLSRREEVDLVIVADTVLDQFIQAGYLLSHSKVRLVSSGIGLAVRSGEPPPRMDTPEALKGTLLQAKCIAYSASESGKYLTTVLYDRLGIAKECLAKSRFVGGGERTGDVVARGEADIACQQLSELYPVQGISHITPLPDELQKISIFSGGVSSWSQDPKQAQEVLSFFTSDFAKDIIRQTGLTPFSGD
jgi:molybdate transport system substrate-binding protein